MFSKRNAIIGWLVMTFGKPIAKRKLKSKAKSAAPGKRGGVIAGAVAGIGAVLGGLMFWRKRRGKGESATSS
jgi:hypothetical protein